MDGALDATMSDGESFRSTDSDFARDTRVNTMCFFTIVVFRIVFNRWTVRSFKTFNCLNYLLNLLVQIDQLQDFVPEVDSSWIASLQVSFACTPSRRCVHCCLGDMMSVVNATTQPAFQLCSKKSLHPLACESWTRNDW